MSTAYVKINEDAAKRLTLGSGIIATGFTPATGEVTGIVGATSGGITFNPNIEYTDFGEDIDQIPNNMMEFKKITGCDPTVSGNLVEITPATAKNLVGAADLTEGTGKITPRDILTTADFLPELWFIVDYSDHNVNESGSNGAKAGFVAIELINALNTTGFQLTTSKDAKAQYAFEFHGHYSIEDQDTVPYNVYVKSGTAGT